MLSFSAPSLLPTEGSLCSEHSPTPPSSPPQRLYDLLIAKRGDDLINASEKGQVDRAERLINIYGADVNHVPSDQPPPPLTKPT